MPTTITITPSSNPNAVTGAASSINNAIALFDSTTGKLLKDGGGIVVVNGALQSTGIGTGSVVGNARGAGAVDLQGSRLSATQVASGSQSVIGGGISNSATNTNCSIGGGSFNSSTGQFSTISGGSGNSATTTAAYIGGGQSNQVSASYAAILGGIQAKADKYGQQSHAAGYFILNGDAQTSILIARRITTDATPIELFLDNSSAKLVLANDTTWLFEVSIVARRTDVDNFSAGFTFVGVIDRNTNAASTTLVGVPTKTIVVRDDATWDADVSADVTNGSLKMLVTGAAGMTVRWVSMIQLTEVTG